MSNQPSASMSGEGIDPRLDMTLTREEERATMSNDVFDRGTNSYPLEVYLHYARLEREAEDNDTRPIPDSPLTTLFKTLTGKSSSIVYPPKYKETADHRIEPVATPNSGDDEKKLDHNADVDGPNPNLPEDGPDTTWERNTTYHLMRVASWQTVFYLITTDILGFASAPAAFGYLGYGPGVLVYTFFFLLAFAGGQILWRLYLNMDSARYPVVCYADLAERTFGRFARHVFNILQSVQLILNVALIIMAHSTVLATIINYKFCFIAIMVIWAVAGMIFGQIRSLRSFGWFTNVSVWLNIVIMVLIIAGSALYEPVPFMALVPKVDLSQPIIRTGWIPPTTPGWFNQVNAVQFAVFAYGGAMIFTEFMAEMRRPRDFWKAALLAQFFCWVIYMFFGLIVYSYQGQYVSLYPSLNFDNHRLQLACNIIGLVTAGVACLLYGNIGVKVLYHNVLRAYFGFPNLMTRKGSFAWVITVICYWAFAWVIGSAVPNIGALVSLIGAACILQFTYTFPPLLALGHWMQLDAMKADGRWVPGMEHGSQRIDTWRDISRWKRSLAHYWYAKVFLFLIFLAALSCAALGIYSGVETCIQAFQAGSSSAFSCRAPNQPPS